MHAADVVSQPDHAESDRREVDASYPVLSQTGRTESTRTEPDRRAPGDELHLRDELQIEGNWIDQIESQRGGKAGGVGCDGLDRCGDQKSSPDGSECNQAVHLLFISGGPVEKLGEPGRFVPPIVFKSFKPISLKRNTDVKYLLVSFSLGP